MNIHHHLVKHRVLDFEVLNDSCTGNISFLLSGLPNGKKIQGSEFRPYSYWNNKRYCSYDNLKVNLPATMNISFWGVSECKKWHTQTTAYLFPGEHISQTHSFLSHCKWLIEDAKLLIWSLRTFVLKNHKENGGMVSCVETSFM